MPYQDGTGPEGTGPTGRQMGPCGDGETKNEQSTSGYGRGRRGHGSHRRGHGRGFHARMHGVARLLDDVDTLQAEKVWLEKRLNRVNQAIDQKTEG